MNEKKTVLPSDEDVKPEAIDFRDAYRSQFNLPSRGQFYKGKLPEGLVDCEPWGVKEEKLLAGAKPGRFEVLDEVYEKCLINCPILPPDWITLERFAFLLHLRIISTGRKMYPYGYQCANESCKGMNERWIDLQKLLDDMTLPDPSWSEPFEVLLPQINKTVHWHYLRGQDEVLLGSYGRQAISKGMAAQGDPEYDRRLAFTIEKIDGKEVKLSTALEFVDQLKGIDSLALRNDYEAKRFGVNMRRVEICDHCLWEQKVVLPLNEEFFRPERPDPIDKRYLGT